MIDVNKITSTLAKLPDQQLQQYAQMHKNDPYIMALAMSESNRRKEMRSAGQGGMQEQPKVVDQMVAEMAPQQLPEDMGIGQLPAGEMNFAGGGIIAFADGGDVEQYQFGGVTSDVQRILQKSPAQRTPQENALLQQAGVALQSRPLGADSGVGAANTFLENLGPRIRNYLTEGASQLSDEELAVRPNVGGVMNERILRNIGIDPTAPRSAAPAAAAPSFTPAVNRSMLNQVEQPARANTAVYGAPAKAEAKGKDKTDSGASTDKAAAKKETGFDALLKSLDGAAAAAPTDSGFSQKITDLTNARVQARREEAEGLDAIHKQFSDVFKGREERLSKREGELGKMKDQGMGLALLQAGAAMMSTPGSLGTAIGKGVDVGSKQYAAGMDKLNAAKEKLSDARDRLDELNAQRGEMSAREKLKAASAIRTEEAAGLELLLKADMDFNKISREEALKRLELRTRIGIAQLQEQGQNVRAAAANRPGAEIQAVERLMKEKDIPFSEALALYKNTQRESVSQEKLRGDWLDPAKRLQIAQDYPNVKTFDDYMTVMGAGTGGGAGGFRVVGVR
jgi:hypothetical protein